MKNGREYKQREVYILDEQSNTAKKKSTPFDFENFQITNLFGKAVLESIQEKIAKATGLAFVTVDYKGDPVTKMTAFTPFCKRIRENKEALQMCKSSDAYGAIQAAVSQETCMYYCPCGLLEVAIPIIIEGHYLGGFIGGQVRCSDAPESVCSLEKLRTPLQENVEDLHQSADFKTIPEMSYEKFQAVAAMVSTVITHLGEGAVAQIKTLKKVAKAEQMLNGQKHEISRLKAQKSVSIEKELNLHFLFGCLTSISNLAMIEDAPRTNEMVTLLSELMRGNFQSETTCSLERELENVKRYLEIQKIRFGEKINYQIDCVDDLESQKVLCMSVMVFVENAVVNAIVSERDGGSLFLNIEKDEEILCITLRTEPVFVKKEVQDPIPPTRHIRSKNLESNLQRMKEQIATTYGEVFAVRETTDRNGAYHCEICLPLTGQVH